ncbi:MAG: ankyrin repeat domain-containing protein [Parashewanella sp.]
MATSQFSAVEPSRRTSYFENNLSPEHSHWSHHNPAVQFRRSYQVITDEINNSAESLFHSPKQLIENASKTTDHPLASQTIHLESHSSAESSGDELISITAQNLPIKKGNLQQCKQELPETDPQERIKPAPDIVTHKQRPELGNLFDVEVKATRPKSAAPLSRVQAADNAQHRQAQVEKIISRSHSFQYGSHIDSELQHTSPLYSRSVSELIISSSHVNALQEEQEFIKQLATAELKKWPTTKPLQNTIKRLNAHQIKDALAIPHVINLPTSRRQRTPLHVFVTSMNQAKLPNQLTDRTHVKMLAIQNLLIASGANPNTPDKFGHTALHMMASNTDALMFFYITKLLDAGANPNIRNAYGVAPWQFALRNPVQTKVIPLMFEKMLVQLLPIDTQLECIAWCTVTDNQDLIPSSLIALATSLTTKETEKLTVTQEKQRNIFQKHLHYARQMTSQPTTVSLTRYQQVLTQAIVEGNCQAAQQAINDGALINLPDQQGQTALHHAIINNPVSTAMVSLLLNSQAEPNQVECRGNTPLSFAVERQHHELVALLMNYNADPNIANLFGFTPLHIAVSRKEPDENTVQRLVSSGANPFISANNQITPLHLVFLSGNFKLLTLLLEKTLPSELSQTELIKLATWTEYFDAKQYMPQKFIDRLIDNEFGEMFIGINDSDSDA